MKKIILFLIIIFCCTHSSSSQYLPLDTISPKYFPLAIGNVWVYNWISDLGIYGSLEGLLKNKIVNNFSANGKHYLGFQNITNSYLGYGGCGTKLLDSMRVDSITGNIYQYMYNSNSECLYDSLNSKFIDTCKNLCVNSFMVLTDTSSENIFGQSRQLKEFTMMDFETYCSRKYFKDIGLYYWSAGQNQVSCSFTLKGCVINGVVYGDTSFFYTVSGTVRYEDNNQTVNQGYVKALMINPVTMQVVTVDSTNIQSNGTYSLTHMPHDSTYIMAYGNDEEDFVPTYHNSTIYWQNADVIYPNSNLSNVDVKVYRINRTPGQMHIAGGVFTSSYSLTGIQNAITYVKFGHQFEAFSISGVTGSYRDDSLSQNSYTVICDRIGYNGGTRNVTLASSSQDTINFYLNNIIGINPKGVLIPTSFKLYQNYPNPFNPSTTIKFDIPAGSSPLLERGAGLPDCTRQAGGFVTLKIYDLLGREVATLINENLSPGTYKVEWNASNYASGLYFYKLTVSDPETSSGFHFTETKKLVLLK